MDSANNQEKEYMNAMYNEDDTEAWSEYSHS